MPQGGRKVAFSTKQKKIQLQQKRDRKRGPGDRVSREEPVKVVPATEEPRSLGDVIRINAEGDTGQRSSRVFRYCLQFKKESPQELQRRKELARQPYTSLPEVTSTGQTAFPTLERVLRCRKPSK